MSVHVCLQISRSRNSYIPRSQPLSYSKWCYFRKDITFYKLDFFGFLEGILCRAGRLQRWSRNFWMRFCAVSPTRFAMMSRGLLSVCYICQNSTTCTQGLSAHTLTPLNNKVRTRRKDYLKNCLFHFWVKWMVVQYRSDRSPIRRTTACLIMVVAYQLILHYSLNMKRHLQLYFITRYYQREARQ
jgi:hypothetical protein